jgi:BirA family transcriptional regulator, biotin operon repressor / biotin---[acetyl-CoA-carboxylase] ligase
MIDLIRIMREASVVKAEHHATLASTNDRAAYCAKRNESELPFLVIADRQTAGRGRNAKPWWSDEGALMFSLLVDATTVGAKESRSPLVALAAAVAVSDAVAALMPSHRVGIHWPNDVYVAGQDGQPDRKLAGILVEVQPNRRHVIGIGLNVNNAIGDAPAELRNKVATIFSLAGRRYDRTMVLIDLLHRLDGEFQRLRTKPSEVTARTNALCLQRDQTLTLQQGNQKTVGRCKGIAEDGALLLETSAGIEKFYSGSIIQSG